jgi:hypothetical protein
VLARTLPGASALLMAMLILDSKSNQTPKTLVIWNCKVRSKLNDIFTKHAFLLAD